MKNEKEQKKTTHSTQKIIHAKNDKTNFTYFVYAAFLSSHKKKISVAYLYFIGIKLF